MLADVTHGGAWHIGVLAAPGIPEMLLAGRERAFLVDYAIPSLNGTADAFTDDDVNELIRAYARDGGFRGAEGLYRSLLTEADEIRALAAEPLKMPGARSRRRIEGVHSLNLPASCARRHACVDRGDRTLRRNGSA